MPTGCGTWPAWWSVGPSWPRAGEIDVIEGVNVSPFDATTLHTNGGCTVSGRNASASTGTPGVGSNGQPAENCDVDAPGQYSNQGCSVGNTAAGGLSYGAPFNAQRGGTVAHLWDPTDGVSAWFWPRGTVPPDVAARMAPDPKAWGEPYALFPFSAATCDGAAHFHDHQLIFDLTFCGDWAGADFASG